MIRPVLSLCCCITFFAIAPAVGFGQSSENHVVEHLEASELGPYEPTKTPDLKAAEQKIVEQTNKFRQDEQREKVAVDETLQKTAEAFAQYMAKTDDYGHRADNRSPSERATAQGYEFCMVSENIAYQFKTSGFETSKLATNFVEGWKNSPGHRKNMLEPDVTQTGVAIAQSENTGVFYAVQLFGRPESEKIAFRLLNKTEAEFKYQIGEEQFTLPPLYARKHTLCRPSQLKWLPDLKADAKNQKPREIKPEDGDEFQVQTEENTIQLEPVETPENSSPGTM
jgi:uncharacterized protein YkwD